MVTNTWEAWMQMKEDKARREERRKKREKIVRLQLVALAVGATLATGALVHHVYAASNVKTVYATISNNTALFEGGSVTDNALRKYANGSNVLVTIEQTRSGAILKGSSELY